MPNSDGLAEGDVFAGYTIVRRLGAGGMGQVYLAQHPRLPRRDALKILPGDLTDNLEFRQRFNREADLAASLYHEHIVGIHDRGEYEGQLWISMDYVEGTDAAQLLRRDYPAGMPKTDVVQIISAVADALDYAHSRGLLHRDVKPANILLGTAGPRRRILLGDFGIARELGEISGLTATNMLVGTTAYCAPEQLRGADVDPRADQYALGCTAFNLLAGSAPFAHSNPAVVIGHHLSTPPPRLGERRPALAELDAVIARAMAKNPDERFATCGEFATALAGQPATAPAPLTGRADAVAAPTPVIARPPEPTPKTRGGRPGAVTVVAAVVAVALVGVAVVVGINLLGGKSRPPAAGTPSPSAAAPGGAVAAPPPAPVPSAAPTITLSTQITDQSGVLGPVERAAVDRALTRLYNGRGTRLWVVYVKDFGGLRSFRWAENAVRANGLGDSDALLAIATDEPSYSFRVPGALANGTAIDVEKIRRDRIGPAVYHREWARAAIAAANGLEGVPG
ncbi:serine/threonine-protein kinase [Mycobacterium servetii]|uniref:non-specific serine/threonine protein kinase n=1 Tax=Mycobacterium servetii TaxID=3237418 RepID=A0ABV4C726_9MYCO